MSKTRKNVPWKGWKSSKPSFHQRTLMMKKCGKKCFLGTNKSFPICRKNTCKISKAGIYAAYIRSRQYSSKNNKYKRIASKARRLL
jgi:hypothetical protein